MKDTRTRNGKLRPRSLLAQLLRIELDKRAGKPDSDKDATRQNAYVVREGRESMTGFVTHTVEEESAKEVDLCVESAMRVREWAGRCMGITTELMSHGCGVCTGPHTLPDVPNERVEL